MADLILGFVADLLADRIEGPARKLAARLRARLVGRRG